MTSYNVADEQQTVLQHVQRTRRVGQTGAPFFAINVVHSSKQHFDARKRWLDE
ncbi:hypothetical protein [Collinsella intestinalis]|uniref:hypothetical protein n=1 Tax=Collinsella intestinalis TaxID=147207 RepID=UPI00195765AB|nr:hypothetical protein [Collinsella intestinalis]MBM6682328.1 hypothetical protein [Collinsella intestinalis]